MPKSIRPKSMGGLDQNQWGGGGLALLHQLCSAMSACGIKNPMPHRKCIVIQFFFPSTSTALHCSVYVYELNYRAGKLTRFATICMFIRATVGEIWGVEIRDVVNTEPTFEIAAQKSSPGSSLLLCLRQESVVGASLIEREPSLLHAVGLKRWLRCRSAS